MKVKELIEMLKKYKDYDVEVNLFLRDNSKWGATLQSFEITKIADIGHSGKTIILDTKHID